MCLPGKGGGCVVAKRNWVGCLQSRPGSRLVSIVSVTITLPDRLDATRIHPLLLCAQEIASTPVATVDARKVQFSYPFGVVMLGAALLRREATGLPPPAYVEPQGTEARDFLREVGFSSFVTKCTTPRWGTLALRRLPAKPLDPVFGHEVGKLIEQRVPNTSESVAYLVETAIKEMLQNVEEHAESTTDLVVLVRWYAKEHNVRIAMADSGVGFVKSLERNPANRDLDSRELLRRAVVVEGTTGRTAQRLGGMGLKHLHKVCVARGGAVHVATNNLDVHFDADHATPISKWVPPQEGTTIEIDFRPGPDDGSRVDEPVEEFF